MSQSTDPRRVRVEFRATLPYRLTSLLALLAFAPEFEGLDPQLSAVHDRLAPGLQRDIELLFLPLGEGLIVDRLCAETPILDDFAAFAGWLANTNPTDVMDASRSLLEGLEGARGPSNESGTPVPPIEDEQALRSFLLHVSDGWAEKVRQREETLDGMVRHLRNPVETLARLVFILTRFWDDHGRALYDSNTSIIDRSMSYHERQEYSGPAAEIFHTVTGQSVLCDESQQRFEGIRRMVFIPSCYIGARTMLSKPPGDAETILVTFNARSTGVREGRQAELIGQVFSPLRALADETRLHIVTLLRGRELYAQQIVDQLEQTQSTVSRHLSLLVAGGILSVRKESGMKFYNLNRPSVGRFLKHLREMTCEEEDGPEDRQVVEPR